MSLDLSHKKIQFVARRGRYEIKVVSNRLGIIQLYKGPLAVLIANGTEQHFYDCFLGGLRLNNKEAKEMYRRIFLFWSTKFGSMTRLKFLTEKCCSLVKYININIFILKYCSMLFLNQDISFRKLWPQCFEIEIIFPYNL